jgi:hypothetical protein
MEALVGVHVGFDQKLLKEILLFLMTFMFIFGLSENLIALQNTIFGFWEGSLWRL